MTSEKLLVNGDKAISKQFCNSPFYSEMDCLEMETVASLARS